MESPRITAYALLNPAGESTVFEKLQYVLSKCPGLYCNRTWDGWSCWDDTPAGVLAEQYCPDYFPDFDAAGRGFICILYFVYESFRFFLVLKRKSDTKYTTKLYSMQFSTFWSIYGNEILPSCRKIATVLILKSHF